MNGKRIQFNGRKAISLLLAVLILTLAVAPALAEEDEGGGFQPARDQAIVLDDEGMDFLSLQVARRTAVTSGTPAIVRVNDEAMGYLSLKGARIETPAARPSLAIADDEGMGFFSLKLARRTAVTSGTPAIARVNDEKMGYLSLKGARIGTPAARPSLAIADDEGMGFLSLQVAGYIPVTSGTSALARTQ